ncbi:MAG: zinc metalloprotease HtpX [Candidatus Pacebacteria bacterium]|nr:zinc metalloprotease HtpX [Candidatus Paceibacterota bacterium]MBP9058517.1 zinc metalloprotease HtpX [Candidatus Paceibacterota bacterium]MBP9770017.1 zinc metalloprotease HtpX [Candidatus Paceibacterota bacterium]
MATLYTQQDKNVRKTWLLMTTFLVLIVAIGFVFAQIYGNPNILYGFFAFSLLMNIYAYWNSAKIALRVSRAIPADENKYRELHNIIENLSITAGLPKPKVYIINDPAPNAFATGRNAKHSAVAFTTGILEILDKNELEGVAAHELSHIGNKDILLSTIAVVLAGFISLIADIFLRSNLFRGSRDQDNKAGSIMMIVGIVLAILAPIFATLVQFSISRKREFLADASGALLTRYPEGLASALKKISSYSRPMQNAHQATAHLFISNPFGAKNIKNLFSTHPPVEDRINALLGKK